MFTVLPYPSLILNQARSIWSVKSPVMSSIDMLIILPYTFPCSRQIHVTKIIID